MRRYRWRGFRPGRRYVAACAVVFVGTLMIVPGMGSAQAAAPSDPRTTLVPACADPTTPLSGTYNLNCANYSIPGVGSLAATPATVSSDIITGTPEFESFTLTPANQICTGNPAATAENCISVAEWVYGVLTASVSTGVTSAPLGQGDLDSGCIHSAECELRLHYPDSYGPDLYPGLWLAGSVVVQDWVNGVPTTQYELFAPFQIQGTPPPLPTPTAAINYHPSGSVANQWVFDGSPSHPSSDGAAIVSYDWDFGDGDKATTDAPITTITHTFAHQGDRTVRLTVTDADGQTGTTTTTLSPQLTVTELQHDPDQIGVGKSFTESVTVENDGPTAITDVVASATSSKSTVASLKDSPTPAKADIPPGLAQTFTFDGTAGLAGTATVTAAASGHVAGTKISATAHTAVVTVSVASSAVACTPGSTATDPLECTATITSGATPAHTPTGVLTFTAPSGALTPSQCTLVPAGPSSAQCSVNYQPVASVGTLPAPPTISVTYPGDSIAAPTSASQTLDCTSGVILQLNSISTSAPHPNGYQTSSTVTLHGCGLSAGATTTFGSDTAKVDADTAQINADGTALTVDVPVSAITGTVSTERDERTATLPDPLSIDSFRNTEAFSFKNQNATLTRSEFIDEFATSDVTVAPGSHALKPWAALLYTQLKAGAAGGVCFGYALTSGELDENDLPLSTFDDAATTPYQLTNTPELFDYLTSAWLAQVSNENIPFIQTQRDQTLTSLETRLTTLLGPAGKDDANSPVVVSIWGHEAGGSEGHAELAYGWAHTPTDGDQNAITLYTYDSNQTFQPAENTDHSGATHDQRLARSWITIDGNGNWRAPIEALRGDIGNLYITPTDALSGQLTVDSHTTANRQLDTTVLTPNDNVESVHGDSGAALSLTGSSALSVVPDASTDDRRASTANSQIGQGGILELLSSAESTTVALNAGTGNVTSLWEAPDRDSYLDSTSGHVAATFDRTTGELAVAPVPDEATPASASVSVIAQLNNDSAERELVVVGAPSTRFAARFSSDATTVTITSSAGGIYHATLHVVTATGDQSVTLASVHLGAGQSVTIRPEDWGRLTTAPQLTLSPAVSLPRTTGTGPAASTTVAGTGEPANPALLLTGLVLLCVGAAISVAARRKIHF